MKICHKLTLYNSTSPKKPLIYPQKKSTPHIRRTASLASTRCLPTRDALGLASKQTTVLEVRLGKPRLESSHHYGLRGAQRQGSPLVSPISRARRGSDVTLAARHGRGRTLTGAERGDRAGSWGVGLDRVGQRCRVRGCLIRERAAGAVWKGGRWDVVAP